MKRYLFCNKDYFAHFTIYLEMEGYTNLFVSIDDEWMAIPIALHDVTIPFMLVMEYE